MADDSNTPPTGRDGDIRPISITDEMRRSYVDYAMSVIVSRALPDARDGLKPVHRRILYAMHESGYDWNKSYKKSSRVVGDVMGKYHPHGDSAIYDSLVRMAQEFSMRLPLIDGQGNFGSLDGDPAAAMRYTEVRLEKAAHALLDDLDKNTVDFRANYDDSMREPTVLPARFPNLLVNGAGGIAVGMATNIPPHNLGEVIDATIALIAEPRMSVADLLAIMPGPDFPTGGIILGRSGIRSAYETGRGSIVMRGRVAFETTRRDREAIIVTEVPYQVNKATMIEKIAELAREKRIEGIADIRDESDRDGVRVVIELKRDAVADVVLNQLYRFTPLQTNFGGNFVALNGNRPEQLGLKDILHIFIAFREEVVSRRTKFLLAKARDRAHVLVGLAIAVANIDEVIHLIRTSPDPQTARERLMARDWPARDIAPLVQLIADPRHFISTDDTYRLSQEQARAILDLRLQRLTALGRDEIAEELEKLAVEIREYLEILGSRARILQIVTDELAAIRDEFATPRRTEILEGGADLEDEDLIQREDMVVTVSHAGYIKRVALSEYRSQRRGGKGRSGMSTREEDFVTKLFVANTHTLVLFFSSRGMVYKMKVWRLPLAAPQARGKALVNLLPLEEGERITSILPLPDDEAQWADRYVMFATSVGSIRRNNLSDCVPRTSLGKRVMEFENPAQSIIGVELCSESDDVLLTSAFGQCIRFRAGDIRVFGGNGSTGTSLGNRGIALASGDRVISLSILHHFDAAPAERIAYLKQSSAIRRAATGEEPEEPIAEAVEEAEGESGAAETYLGPDRYAEMGAAEQFVLTINERGYGKRSSSYEFRISGRGGKGIRATDISKLDEIGALVAAFPVEPSDQLMLVSNGGTLIRVPVEGIRFASRTSKGVRVFNTAADEKVVSVERISESAEAEPEAGEAEEGGGEEGGAPETE
ncbi:DNA gyrase subunit A [Faunimonas sp. B44]|uniref:DNA gyrase subunit A n=1 Tax=Faunimonas sp. B44 TaxID=3461493 RepID=UPI004043CE46